MKKPNRKAVQHSKPEICYGDGCEKDLRFENPRFCTPTKSYCANCWRGTSPPREGN